MLRIGAISIALLLLAPRGAEAEKMEKISVLGLETLDASEADAARLTEALRQRLADMPQATVVPGKDYVELKLVFGCEDEMQTSCMAQAGQTLGVDKLIYGTLKGIPKRPWARPTLSLRMVDVRTGEAQYVPAEQLGPQEMSAAGIQGLAARLLGMLMGIEVKSTITIVSDPPGAEVVIDDRFRGLTPLKVAHLLPGGHHIIVRKDGFSSSSESRSLRAGETAKMHVALAPLPLASPPAPAPAAAVAVDEPAKPRTAPSKVARIVALSSLGVAVVAASLAIFTWSHYSDLEGETQERLAALKGIEPDAWLAAPDCKPPLAASSPAALAYSSRCHEGNDYADATTALWVTTGVLATASLVAFIASFPLKAGEGEKQAVQARCAPRLKLIAPTANAQGAGLTARVEF